MPPEQDETSIDALAGLLTANQPAKGGSAKSDAGTQRDGGADNSSANDDELEDDNGNLEGDDDGEQPEGDDEGTGGEGEGDDDGEAAGDEENDDTPSTEPLYTVKIDGKEKQVTLKEALAGYQRTDDYTRKTQELAERRTAADTEAAQLREVREQYANVLNTLQDRLSEVKERTPEEWNQLRMSDPDNYAVEYADFQRREHTRGVVAAEKQRVESEKQEAGKKAFREAISAEAQRLDAALPDWRDPKKREAGLKNIRGYGKEIGFSDAELDQVYDHRMVRMANDAAQWRAHLAAQEKAKTKLRDAPEVPAPRNRGPRPDAKKAERKAAQQRFNRSGSIDDAVSLLLK